MRNIRKLMRLPLEDKLLLLKTAFLILGVRIALSLLSFHTVRTRLAHLGKSTDAPLLGADARIVRKVIWAADVTSHYLLPDRPCLTKALVAQMLLSRRGCQTTLRIGVLRDSDRSLLAHAWLEHNGNIVVGHLNDLWRFTPLPPLDVKIS